MATHSFIRMSVRQNLYICASCAFRATKISRRWIGTKYLQKMADAEVVWQEQAKKIRAGEQKSMLTILEERGYVQTITGSRDEVDSIMTNSRIGAYVGVDPTASSLHVGHLLPFMSLFWMYLHGYHTISLLGGATSKIGDPTDRLTTRVRPHSSIRTESMTKMHYQLKKLWTNVESLGRKYGYVWEWSWRRGLLNNNAWMNKLPMMEILQVLGPGMRMGQMLARDTVKNKMSKGDGMSFAEFSYPLLQAWDWWHMYHTLNISMQIGGSDQYGNIRAGIDAIKYLKANHPNPIVRGDTESNVSPLGFTVPLLTTSTGEKFGKSAGNAIWLDGVNTSAFDLYGFFLRTADKDVEKYLKLFTFMPLEQIDTIVKEHMEKPSLRKGQHALARDLLELVHGEVVAENTQLAHRSLLGSGTPLQINRDGGVTETASQLPTGILRSLNDLPTLTVKLPREKALNMTVGRFLYAARLASSPSEGHRIAADKAVYIGGQPDDHFKRQMSDSSISYTAIKTWKTEDTSKFIIHDNLLILRRGKHNVRIVQLIPDEEYAASGETYPGMETTKDEIPGKLLTKSLRTDRKDLERADKRLDAAENRGWGGVISQKRKAAKGEKEEVWDGRFKELPQPPKLERKIEFLARDAKKKNKKLSTAWREYQESFR
ncbi:hypothetical protein B7494_g7646 [Chlorociboria aeruginascens]|nr:hypothetical protein B7494_g7646 [Chlorociboria aeruginascens]